MYYRQPSEECVWNCILQGGHRFECEHICSMFPLSANYYTHNPYSMPATKTPTAPYGLSQATPYSPQPYYYGSYPYSFLPEDDPCVQECRRLNIPSLNCCFRCGYC